MMDTMIDNLKRLKQRALYQLRKLEQTDLRSMKASALRMRTAGLLAGIFAFVWWCVLYPELCFPQDTYEAVYETGEENPEAGDEGAAKEGMKKEGAENEKFTSAEGNFRGLLQAEEEQVIVKSRLLEWLERYKAE